MLVYWDGLGSIRKFCNLKKKQNIDLEVIVVNVLGITYVIYNATWHVSTQKTIVYLDIYREKLLVCNVALWF